MTLPRTGTRRWMVRYASVVVGAVMLVVVPLANVYGQGNSPAEGAAVARFEKAALAESAVTLREVSMGRDLDQGYRAALISRLSSLSVEELNVLQSGGAIPSALGDSQADLVGFSLKPFDTAARYGIPSYSVIRPDDGRGFAPPGGELDTTIPSGAEEPPPALGTLGRLKQRLKSIPVIGPSLVRNTPVGLTVG